MAPNRHRQKAFAGQFITCAAHSSSWVHDVYTALETTMHSE